MRINKCQRGHGTCAFDPKTSCTKVQKVFENVILMSSIVSRFIYIILSQQTIQGLQSCQKATGKEREKQLKVNKRGMQVTVNCKDVKIKLTMFYF